MNALFTNSSPQYIDFSQWDFSKVTSASDVIPNKKTVAYLGNHLTITANKLNILGFGQVDQPIILASGGLYQVLSGNQNEHLIQINNAAGNQIGTITVPVVYNAGAASDATAAINGYKAMVDQQVQQYADAHNCALKLKSSDPINDLTGHNNHLVNYAEATYATTTVIVKFVDDDDHGSSLDSHFDQKKTLDKNNQVQFTIPANYQLVANQDITEQTGNQATLTHEPTGGQVTVTIHLVHQTKQVDGNTADLPADVKKSLNKDVSRTINYTGLSADQIAQIPAGQKTQTVHLTGKATYDLVTKKLISAITWDPVQMNGFTPRGFSGFVSRVVSTDGNQVPSITVTADSQPEAVTVNYKQAQFKIDVLDETTNKLLFPDGYTWKITYTSGWVNIAPDYPAGNYQSVGVTGVPHGVRITGDQVKDLNNPDTSWWIPNFYCDSEANEYDLAGATITIHVVHKLKDVTISGADGKTYDGQPGEFASDRPITITGTDMVDNTGIYMVDNTQHTLNISGITIADFKWDNANRTDAGSYTLTPNDQASLIQTLQTDNPKYGVAYLKSIGGQLDYTIKSKVTFEFVYHDNHDTVVGTPVTQGMTINQDNPVTPALTIPDKYVLASGQTLPTSYTPRSNEAVVKIQLAHKIDDVQETATRTAKVQYIYANGDKAGQQAAADAVLEVAYVRTNKKDEVTGQVTAGNWLWDQSKNDDGFDHGYKVLAGNWTLPQNWAVVSVQNPDVDGYQAITTGDWETNKDGSQSSVPANLFVFPTYTGRPISTDGGNSVAYTGDAPVYEARPVHTVYYAAVKDEGRVVTKFFKKYDHGTYTDADVITLPDGTKQSYAQIKVWYQSTPAAVITHKSSDPTKWQVTYNDWAWNKNGGDQKTPGFTVISGQGLWGGIDNNPGGDTWNINAPALDGYTVVNFRQDLGRISTNSGAPKVTVSSVGTTNAFNDAATDWYYRNNLTTYYVPNADLQRTITRTINVDGEAPVVQTVTFNRRAYINPDDTGIVFGAIIDGDAYQNVIGDNVWNHKSTDPDGIPTGTWDEHDLTKPGYTAVIDDHAVTKVPSETINPDTKNQTVNVHYIKNEADIKISHPAVKVTYGETVGIPTGITNSVTASDPLLTLPTGSDNVQLSADDYSFADKNGQLLRQTPVNAGTLPHCFE